MRTRLIACLVLLSLAAPALAQPATTKRPQSLEARLDALEKENATLRADVDRLQQQLTRTRNGLSVTSGLAAQALPYSSTNQQPTVAQQQAQADAIIRQQDTATRLNNLQLQQNLMMDRQREQQLFLPQPYGALPPAPGITPMPGPN